MTLNKIKIYHLSLSNNIAFNETQFLPSRCRVDTVIWMHYMDAKQKDGEKA